MVILDNSLYPEGGARPEDDLILEFSYFNEYVMMYSLRDTSVIMGIISMVLAFMIGAFTYLGCKIRRDIRWKFLGDEGDETDEDEMPEDDDNDNLKQRLISNDNNDNPDQPDSNQKLM